MECGRRRPRQFAARPGHCRIPEHVQRLVIVPDGDLHGLPFEALQPSQNRPRLGDRFEITLAPSVTLWLRLGPPPRRHRTARCVCRPGHHARERDRRPASSTVAVGAPRSARNRTHPAARCEPCPGRGEASEQFLKGAALTRYSILHFAAHARADDAFPDRSAVFLAPGGAAEDGWLEPREIAALDLRGRLVVLSACESAGGFVMSAKGR